MHRRRIAPRRVTPINTIGHDAGLGDVNARIKVYIANRPSFQDFTQLNHTRALNAGDIEALSRECGNGWRKVFNVYAKLLFAWRSADARLNAYLPGHECDSWQAYRDQFLLRTSSQTSLIFPPLVPLANSAYLDTFAGTSDVGAYHIIMGRTYAKSLLKGHSASGSVNVTWLDNEFAIDRQAKILVCPYFDYRQLSNMKIIRLVELLLTV